VLFAVEASRRWAGDGISANALHPGAVATSLQRHVGGARYIKQAARRYAQEGVALKTVHQGAGTSVLLAAHADLEGIGGRYFEDCAPARVVHESGAGLRGVASYALDPGNAARLWDVSLDLLAARARTAAQPARQRRRVRRPRHRSVLTPGDQEAQTDRDTADSARTADELEATRRSGKPGAESKRPQGVRDYCDCSEEEPKPDRWMIRRGTRVFRRSRLNTYP
jgi:NAD(P)-dependent dehydrogenase (short-subunit alcohol dehydrogenase family)